MSELSAYYDGYIWGTEYHLDDLRNIRERVIGFDLIASCTKELIISDIDTKIEIAENAIKRMKRMKEEDEKRV